MQGDHLLVGAVPARKHRERVCGLRHERLPCTRHVDHREQRPNAARLGDRILCALAVLRARADAELAQHACRLRLHFRVDGGEGGHENLDATKLADLRLDGQVLVRERRERSRCALLRPETHANVEQPQEELDGARLVRTLLPLGGRG